MKTITIRGTEHRTATDAIQWLAVSNHDKAISVSGRLFSVTAAEFDRLDRIGVVQAQWFVERDRLVSVPF